MKYLKTFEDYSGQIDAGNTASSAPMNVNQSADKQPGNGDAVVFMYSPPNGSKPIRAEGKILSMLQSDGVTWYELTLNVEGSDFNDKSRSDKENSVTVPENLIKGPYLGLRNPTGSGFVSANTNMDVVAKGSGVYAGNDGAGNFGSGPWPTDSSNLGL